MFCSQCGNKVDEEALFCAHCGARVVRNNVAPAAQPIAQNNNVQCCNCGDRRCGAYGNNASPSKPNDNTVGIVGFILSFLVPLAGLICSIIGYNNAKKGAPNRGLSVAGIIISAISVGIVVLVYFIWFCAFLSFAWCL